jgi:RNA polymerase sigma-70 factor (ECF subfamily)
VGPEDGLRPAAQRPPGPPGGTAGRGAGGGRPRRLVAGAGPDDPRPGPSPSEAAAAAELAERVAAAVATLPEADREVLLLRNIDELPYEEVGMLLGVEPAAARKRYGRALIRLQQALADRGILGDQP